MAILVPATRVQYTAYRGYHVGWRVKYTGINMAGTLACKALTSPYWANKNMLEWFGEAVVTCSLVGPRSHLIQPAMLFRRPNRWICNRAQSQTSPELNLQNFPNPGFLVPEWL